VSEQPRVHLARPGAVRSRLKRSLRFSLTSLAVLTLIIATGCAALVSSSERWTYAAFTVTSASLAVSLLASLIWRGAQQARALGFAVFAWMYFMHKFLEVFDTSYYYSPTEAILNAGQPYLFHAAKGADINNFWAIGYCLWTLLLGWIGSGVGSLLYALRREPALFRRLEKVQDQRHGDASITERTDDERRAPPP
jgi:hypothetical protein